MMQKKGIDAIIISEDFKVRDELVKWIEGQRGHGNFNGNLMIHRYRDGANGDSFRAVEMFNPKNPRHVAIAVADEAEPEEDWRFIAGVYEKCLTLAV
jgi:hypothetical protein